VLGSRGSGEGKRRRLNERRRRGRRGLVVVVAIIARRWGGVVDGVLWQRSLGWRCYAQRLKVASKGRGRQGESGGGGEVGVGLWEATGAPKILKLCGSEGDLVDICYASISLLWVVGRISHWHHRVVPHRARHGPAVAGMQRASGQVVAAVLWRSPHERGGDGVLMMNRRVMAGRRCKGRVERRTRGPFRDCTGSLYAWDGLSIHS
jgi:hypothetical protein